MSYAFAVTFTMFVSGLIDSEGGDPGPSSLIGGLGFILTLFAFIGKTYL